MGCRSSRKSPFAIYHCLRALLLIFNVLLWISGMSLIWMGLWMKVDIVNYLKISAAYTGQVPCIFLVFGFIIVFVTLVACSCIVKIEPTMLVIYGGFLITMLFALISLTIYVYTYKDHLLDGLSSGIDREIDTHDMVSSLNTERLIDFVQRKLHCCGNEGFADWSNKVVPQSCCPNQDCRWSAVESNNNKKPFYEEGCASKLRNVIDRDLTKAGIITSAIAFFPLFGSLLSFAFLMVYQNSDYEIII